VVPVGAAVLAGGGVPVGRFSTAVGKSVGRNGLVTVTMGAETGSVVVGPGAQAPTRNKQVNPQKDAKVDFKVEIARSRNPAGSV